MRFWNNSLRTKFAWIFGVVGALILAAVVFGYTGVSASVDEFRRLTEQEITHERVISRMVSGFKKQVQEWKNVLLRGADAKQRQKYWGKFEKQESAIQESGQILMSTMPASKARGLVEDFLRSHNEMGSAYRNGYQAFVNAGFDASVGDKAVKGIDRAPTKLLETAADEIAQAAKVATESARAGDQGRGFAVVADEVRSLAQRTQESTQEIQATIEHLQGGAKSAVQAMDQGQGRVADGVEHTRKVGEALENIADSVDNIVDKTARIAAAAEEQGVVAQDLSRNVSGIDQSSREMVDGAEAVAQTSQRIATLSSSLAQAAARFRV